MIKITSLPWKELVKSGLLAGVISLVLALIGIVATFNNKALIFGLFTMGQAMLWAPIALYAYLRVQQRVEEKTPAFVLISGAVIGLAGGAVLAALLVLGQLVNLRDMFINASPQLFEIITFKISLPAGTFIPLIVGALAGALASALCLLPNRLRLALTQAILWVVLLALLRDLIVTVISRWGFLGNIVGNIFAISGLSKFGALLMLALIGGLQYWRLGLPPRPAAPARLTGQAKNRRLISLGAAAVLLLLLPQILGIFFSEILDNVGIYIIMGLGLNIVVGYAGLLDLGYVAFYAIGAYTVGVLTSPELNATPLTYWQALPIALLVSFTSGLLLGMPVLRMRGDYLAIVTLGFGEIIRILVLSDWLRPILGGAQGIQGIAQPTIGSFTISTQQELYYLILAGIGIVGFIAWRLKDSRVGRTWMAMREDEDVAQAMGINLVLTKLSAFSMGALFAGLSGTIFAAKLTAAYPHSFNLLVSINVLCLIIVGGMGSIPGVFVGSLFLIGLPDLLREFTEYRYWVYGVVLVVMMLLKPEGLWPEERRKLELHEADEEILEDDDLSPAAGAAD
jgi:branched-chain amino acid transport system permease protein